MSEEESDIATTYPDIRNFENNEAEDKEDNPSIQITPNLGSPETQLVAQLEQANYSKVPNSRGGSNKRGGGPKFL